MSPSSQSEKSLVDLRLHFPLPVGQHLSERSPDIKAVQLKSWHKLLKQRQKINTAPAATSLVLHPYLESRSLPHRNALPSRSSRMHLTLVTSKSCPALQELLSTQHQSCWIWQARMSERKCERLMWSPTSQEFMNHFNLKGAQIKLAFYCTLSLSVSV